MRKADVLQAVTSEWQSTEEIASFVSTHSRIPDRSHHNGVYISLRRLHRDGCIEKRPAHRGAYKVTEWRLAP